MPDLIKFIHGNRAGIKKLVIEFQLFWNSKNYDVTSKASQGENTKPESNTESTPGTPATEKTDSSKQTSTPNTSINESDAPEENFIISKRQLEKKITTIACRAKRPDFPKICWYVHQEVLKQYGLENLPLRDKVLEMKNAEENSTCPSLPSKNTTPNQANLSESKTPVSKSSEKAVNKTPSRDQMSILSFAQTADKLNSSKSDVEGEMEAKSLDMKSPNNKPSRRDQMSILSFTRAPEDLIVVSVQPANDDKKIKDESRKMNTKIESPVNVTKCDHSAGSTLDAVVNKIKDRTNKLADNFCKTDLEKPTPTDLSETNVASVETAAQEKLPETKSSSVDATSANSTPASSKQNSAAAVSGVSTISDETVTSKDDKTISDKGEP